MDCSSPYAMAGLIALDRFDLAEANDTDHDRRRIVTRTAGLLNPITAVSIDYPSTTGLSGLQQPASERLWSAAMIDRVASRLGRRLFETPVGFKWFVDGLIEGSLGFGGEESAGASFSRSDGSVWTTDKDGIVMDLLAAEMTAKTGRDPGELYKDLTRDLGDPVYERIDAPATAGQKAVLNGFPDQVKDSEIAA
jgi:phosphoglucomutase